MFFIMNALFLWQKEQKTRLQWILMGVMIYWALLELKDLIFYPSFLVREAFLPDLLVVIDSSAVAAGLIYLLELISPGWLSWRRALLLSSPFIALTLIFMLSGGAAWAMTLHLATTCLYAGLVTLHLIRAAHRYNRYIDENYSNREFLDIRWLSTSIGILFICLVLWVVSCTFTSWVMDSFFQLSLILLWVPIIYHTKRQREIILREPLKSSEIEGAISLQIKRNLKRELEEKELFLNPQLTLQELASAVGTNRTYLSNYLNQELKTTFYDYINSLRLQRARELLSDPARNITMIEIAEQSGFNSQSTFRRAFRRVHGCSAAEWCLRRQKEG